MRKPRKPAVRAILAAALLAAASGAGADTDTAGSCNPLVRLEVEQAALGQTLAGLAADHDFELTFPAGLDRPVTLAATLPLDRLLARLLRGLSVSMVYRESGGCSQRLARVVILPEGEQVQYREHDLPDASRGPQPLEGGDAEPLVIVDMEQYVADVLARRRIPQLNRMTVDQRREYRREHRRQEKLRGSHVRARPAPVTGAGTPTGADAAAR